MTIAFLAVVGPWIWALPARGGSPLEERVDAVVNARGFEGAHWGLLVVDSATGSVAAITGFCSSVDMLMED